MNDLYTKIMYYLFSHNGDKEMRRITVSNLYDAADNDAKEAINSIFIELCGAPLSEMLFWATETNNRGINLETTDFTICGSRIYKNTWKEFELDE